MGRSVTYPKKERETGVDERERYMSIASQIHNGHIDAGVCVERINRAVDAIRRLEMEDSDSDFESASMSLPDFDCAKKTVQLEAHDEHDEDIVAEPSPAPFESDEDVEDPPASPMENDAEHVAEPSKAPVEIEEHATAKPSKAGAQHDMIMDSTKKLSVVIDKSEAALPAGLAEVPSPVRSRASCASFTAQPPAGSSIGSSNAIRTPIIERKKTDGDIFPLEHATPSVDYSSVGTASELRQGIVRRMSVGHAPLLTPRQHVERHSVGGSAKCHSNGPDSDVPINASPLVVDYSSVGTASELRQGIVRRMSGGHAPLLTPRQHVERLSVGSSAKRHSIGPDSAVPINASALVVDYSSVGTASQLRQGFERRQSGAHSLELTPGKQIARLSIASASSGQDSSMQTDASAFAPGESGYKTPPSGHARELKNFFERQIENIKGDPDGQTRVKKNLADLLNQDQAGAQQQ